jgi:hypothetical protein
MDKNWTKVKPTDYYRKFYKVDGLKAGDKIDVKWKDGNISTEILRIKKGMDSAQIDMNNHPDYFPTQKLYVIHNAHGERVPINLKGKEIRKHG